MKALVAAALAPRLRRLGNRGLDEGLRGNGVWLAVGLGWLGLRLLQRWWPREEVVYRTVLAPGERLEVEHLLASFRQLGIKPDDT